MIKLSMIFYEGFRLGLPIESVRDRLKYQEENKEKVEAERRQKRIEMMINSATSTIPAINYAYTCETD